MAVLKNQPQATSPVNVIVAGITRSGLTATCQMLAAGGMRVAGEYPGYEPFQIGAVPWGKINGQVVKLVDSHHHLPPPGTYAVIRLKRDMREQAKSFRKFVKTFFNMRPTSTRLIRSFERDYRTIDAWAASQHKRTVVEFERIVDEPRAVAEQLATFLGVELDIDAAASVIIPRSSRCHKELLESRMVIPK